MAPRGHPGPRGYPDRQDPGREVHPDRVAGMAPEIQKLANDIAQKTAGKALASLSDAEMVSVVKTMAAPGTVVDGFPLFVFYMCLRSDAVDVVYGTPEGFKKLNIPYMEHILPPEGWNG